MVRTAIALALCAQNALACETVQNVAQAAGTLAPGTCATYLSETGSLSQSCYWEFGFRDPAAMDYADAVFEQLALCGPGAPLPEDQQVNHPDSYALRSWAGAKGTYYLSVKDKGALDQTLVFLRFEPSS